jgi:hypothetical protein
MKAFSGPYPHVAEALVVIFSNALARCGTCTTILQLDTWCNENSEKQWQAFVDHGDSIAFVSWCADKIRYWHTLAYLSLCRQAPLYGAPEKAYSFAIMSPDGQTDWTLAAWHVHYETKSTLPFTSNVVQIMEAEMSGGHI